MTDSTGARLAALVAVTALACGAVERPSGGDPAVEIAALAAAATSSPTPSPAPERDASLGDGFVVWESNRTGSFRLWSKRLDGSGLRRLTPNHGDRVDCCPHIAPDGRAVAYLSLAPGQERYPEAGRATLRLVAADGSGDRQLAASARPYFENRAAVWVDPSTLHYVDGDGYSVRLDVTSGAATRLTAAGRPSRGYLVDATGRWATDGTPTFSRFDAATGAVAAAAALGGCQPYFTHDGRWGFWTAGAGGPIDRIDPATRTRSTLLKKSDPRLPPGRGYL